MSDIPLEAEPPGPDDVVTVTVGGKGTGGRITTAIERGAGKDTHPDGSGDKPKAERERVAKLKSDVEMPTL